MARLRQYFASRYGSQEATSSEFENVIRYLNSAELGNLTVAELLSKLFNEDGDVSLGIEFQFNPATGFEYRQDAASQWTLIASADALRGASGTNMGSIEAPLLSNRAEYVATAAQTVYSYVFSDAATDLLVWINGVLQAPSMYVASSAASTVTLSVAPTTGALVMIATIRASPSVSFLREDLTAVASQILFPFPLAEFDEIIVFRNGIMQREGGAYDYIKSFSTGVITMTTPQTVGSVITIIRISNENIKEVAGLMLENEYTQNGLIKLNKISIPDDGIASAMVNGLVPALASRPSMSVGTTPPIGPVGGDLWVNTAGAVPYMLFYDGVRWINASPNGLLPSPVSANALQFVRLNATATGMEFADIDFSGVIATTQRGAANGVAPLDSSGLIPSSILPDWVARTPITGVRPGSIVNGTFTIGLIEDQVTVDGLTLALSAGTATVQLSIGGALVGSTAAVTTTPTRLAIGAVNVNGSAVPKVVSLVVTGASTATDLAYVVGCLLVGN